MFLDDFWWWEHIADLIALVMSGCLFIIGIILIKWPGPPTWARWGAVVMAFIASFVTFTHVAIIKVNPHPRISVSFFLVFLTIAMLKNRAVAEAKSDFYSRRATDDRS